MRVVFLGTPEFAVPSLKTLLNSPAEVCAVLTQPDRPGGRGHKPQPSPVKLLALEAGIPVFQPERIRNESLKPFIEAQHPDFIVVVAYGQILPRWLLDAARIAPVNVHGSLLPKYRGAAPVIWSVLNGETVSGVTTMLMDEHLDTGAILLQTETSVPPDMTGGELAEQLSRLGAELLLPTLDGLVTGSLRPVPQEDSLATWAPRILKDQARIDWSKSATELHNQIRAFNPRPVAFTYHGDERLQLLRSLTCVENTLCIDTPGTFLRTAGEAMRIRCGGGSSLEILELKPANRRAMSGREYAIGCRLRPGDRIFNEAIPQTEQHQ